MSPIRPESRALYPADWPAISQRIRARARQRCERCGVRNHAWGWRDAAGVFHEVAPGPLREAGYKRPPFTVACAPDGHLIRVIRIVLTVAHLDHDPTNCADENLQALCQRCHLAYDAERRRAGIRQRARASNRDLFEGEDGQHGPDGRGV